MGQKQSTMGGNKSSTVIEKSAAVTTSAASPASPQAEQEPGEKTINLSLLQKKITAAPLQDLIFSYMKTERLAKLFRLNQLFYRATGHEMTLRRLMHHVARGEHDKDIPHIEAILKEHPQLLLQKSHTIDLSGRSFTGLSPWQLAWCNGDDDMVEKMKKYTQSPRIDQQLMADQLQELFPGGYEAHLSRQEASAFNFDALVAAIDGSNEAELQSAIDLKGAILPATEALPEPMTNAGAANELTKALNAFRQEFTKQLLKEELVFNPQHLLRALEIYTARYNDWNYAQCQVFWSQVVGFTQRFMPACYAQAFAQGLYFLTKESNPEVLKRSLSFRFRGGNIFSDVGGFSGLGFKFGVVPTGVRGVHGWCRLVRWWDGVGVPASLSISKNYVKQKQCTLRTYAGTHAADPAGTLVALSK